MWCVMTVMCGVMSKASGVVFDESTVHRALLGVLTLIERHDPFFCILFRTTPGRID